MIKRVVTAVVLIPLVLLLVLKAPLYVMAIVAGAVALLAIAEFLKLTVHYGVQPLWQATYAFVALFFVFVIVASTNRIPLIETTAMIYGLALAAAVAPFVFLAIAMRRGELTTGYPAAAASVFAFAYVAIPMALLVQVRQQPAGAILVIYTLLLVWAGDIFAYFVGKGLGRHPKKTWEGAIASVVASVIVGMLWFQHAAAISTWLLQVGLIERRDGMFGLQQPQLGAIVVLSAIVNIAAQLGDMVESLVKRGAGVKDSGSILPGHGGMLDRIDAMLFAVPMVWAWSAWRLMQ
ncbi:MAG: phosphatidate cytidylyltransferase [Candidatus Koribacter versatilis]|nr:phosphatidate cytidylyltransferase [Candidatus Koribacter versatilis]